MLGDSAQLRKRSFGPAPLLARLPPGLEDPTRDWVHPISWLGAANGTINGERADGSESRSVVGLQVRETRPVVLLQKLECQIELVKQRQTTDRMRHSGWVVTTSRMSRKRLHAKGGR